MRNIPADKKKYTNSVTATSSIFKMEISFWNTVTPLKDHTLCLKLLLKYLQDNPTHSTVSNLVLPES